VDVKNIVTELKSERERLDKAITALESIGETSTSLPAQSSQAKVQAINSPKRRLSAAARRRISEAQKRRWAERKRAA
jgi:hypothetical protein